MRLINKKIAILGGDLRIIYLANDLIKLNAVNVFGIDSHLLNKNIQIKTTLKDVLKNAEIVIGAIPLSRDGVYLNAPFYSQKLLLEEMVEHISGKSIFVGCKIPGMICKKFKNKNIKYFDILEREDFAIANAVPTAEGAIQMAMENTDIVLAGSKCLILGFGRCGKMLAEKLKALGADVTVEARKIKDLEYIKAYQHKQLHLKDLENNINKFQIIFNTIPSLILDEEILQNVQKNCLIIDLASKPGGTDFLVSEKLGINAMLCLGLPGKYAPKTAAQIIINCIENF